MKNYTRRFLLCGAICLLICTAAGKRMFAEDRDAKMLTALDKEWSDAAGTRDLDRVVSFYAEDASVYPPSAPVATGREGARKVWGSYFQIPEFKIFWKTTSAWVDHNLGYTAGTYEDSYTGSDGKTVHETGKYLCVWRKDPRGKWVAIQDMWNTDN